MSLGSLVAFFGFFLEDANFFAFAMTEDFSLDFGIFEVGLADFGLGGSSLGGEEDFVEVYLGVCFGG